MGFKSHMMATMAKWREHDYLTDTIFHCVRFFFPFYEIEIKNKLELLERLISNYFFTKVLGGQFPFVKLLT